jgi:MerR family redox-sensitive transcriptional activator SoxR
MPDLTIGEVARIAGVQTSTLRYYESIGLLPAPRRVSGQRRYSPDILPVLAVIQLAKDTHFTLDEIRALLYGPPEDTTPSQRWCLLVAGKLDEINALIAQAQERKALLEESLESAALQRELDECPLLRAAS